MDSSHRTDKRHSVLSSGMVPVWLVVIDCGYILLYKADKFTHLGVDGHI